MSDVEIIRWSQPELAGYPDFESTLKIVVPQLAQYFKDDLNSARESLIAMRQGSRCIFRVSSVDDSLMEAENTILFLRAYGYQAKLKAPE
jgi:hypothetical protein